MRIAIAFVTVSLMVLGCAAPAVEGGNHPSMPVSMTQGPAVNLVAAPAEMAGLKVHVDADAKTSESWDGVWRADDDGNGVKYVRQSVIDALGSAGYNVVRTGELADVTLHLTYHRDTVFDGTTVKSQSISGSARVERQGKVVDEVVSPRQLDKSSFPNDIVNKLSKSTAVVAIARQVNPNESATEKVAKAPPAAAPAAAPAIVAAAPASVAPAAPVVAAPAAPPAVAASSYVAAAPQPSAYALVIGIEKYRDVPSPTGARGDAEKFAKVAQQTLGVPESHIRVALDDRATKGDIEKHLEWLKANAQPGSRIYFFFSGHGAPEPSTGTSYVLPYDGDPRYLEGTALRLQTILGRLQETKAREVLAVMDSCFSGAGGRSVLPPGARALVRVQTVPVAARIALFSAASGTQTSGPAPGAPGEGLFTQKILEALGGGQGDINGDGQVSLEELRDWVKPRVTREAKRDNRDQTPDLFLGNNVGAASNFIVAWGLATK